MRLAPGRASVSRTNPRLVRSWVVWPFPADVAACGPLRWMQLAPHHTSPCTFASTSKTHWALCDPSLISPKRADFGATLLGFLQRPPLRRHQRRASTPGCPGPGFATPERVPPLSFLLTSAVSSARRLVGLLHPTTDHEVHLVSSRPTTKAATRPSSEVSHPSELFPLRQVVPRHRTARDAFTGVPSPLAVALPPPKRLLRPTSGVWTCRRVRCFHTVLPRCFRSMLPWASRLRAFAPAPERIRLRYARSKPSASHGARTACGGAAFCCVDLATVVA